MRKNLRFMTCLIMAGVLLSFSCEKPETGNETGSLKRSNDLQPTYYNPGSPGVAPVDITHLSDNGNSNYTASWAGFVINFSSLSEPVEGTLPTLKFTYNGREYSAIQAYCNNITVAGPDNATVDETGHVFTMTHSYCAASPSGPTDGPPSLCPEWRSRTISARIVKILGGQTGMAPGLAMVPNSFFTGSSEPVGPFDPNG